MTTNTESILLSTYQTLIQSWRKDLTSTEEIMNYETMLLEEGIHIEKMNGAYQQTFNVKNPEL